MNAIDELDAFVRRVPIALYRTAPDGKLLAANPALARLLGYHTVEELEKALPSVESFYVDPGQRECWIEQIAAHGVVGDFDVELRRRDQSTVWVRDSARVIRNDHGEVLFYEGSLIDVTDKVNAEKAKREFIATVSHELRNPLAVILGMGEELAGRYESFSDVDRRDMAKLIARQAEDASWLIEDLLVAYREDVSTVAVECSAIDVVEEAQRVLEVVDSPIQIMVANGSTMVEADRQRTRQILRNLVSNAQRYGRDPIRMRVAEVDGKVEVVVEDSGDAIPESEVERIFRPFERRSSEPLPGSVGLGLSVAQKLARLMDGDLVYRHTDGWSSFVLSLPAA